MKTTTYLILLIFGLNNINAQPDRKSFFSLNKTAVGFEENKGQVFNMQGNSASEEVLFFTRVNGHKVFLLKTGMAHQFESFTGDTFSDYAQKKDVYRMDILLKNTLPTATISTFGKHEDPTHYHNRNVLNVYTYDTIIYKNIYHLIDWIIYFKDGSIKYDFIIYPGGNPDNIQFEISKNESAGISADGSFIFNCEMGSVIEEKPYCFQGNIEIGSSYHWDGNTLSLRLKEYDKTHILTIDPGKRLWATYYGGANIDVGMSSVTDKTGNLVYCGYTNSSTDIATSGSHQAALSGSLDAFIVKFNSKGKRLWATYYGGSNSDYGQGCTVDSSGNIFLAGYTSSISGIASSSGAHQINLAGNTDAFIAKFNSNGVLQWGTYYGDIAEDNGRHCKADILGNIYLSGETKSTGGMSSSGAHQVSHGGGIDGFLVKFSSTGTRMWATYYGGSGDDYARAVGTDTGNNVILLGETSSSGSIASFGAHKTTLGGSFDAFLVKFNSAGVRQFGTYFGGGGDDQGKMCVVDLTGNIYFSGHTTSTSGISSSGAHQINKKGLTGISDGFLAKFNKSGVQQWSTYCGDSLYDYVVGCTVDPKDRIAISGYTSSISGIATSGSHQTVFGGGTYDAFMTVFNGSGVRQWGSYLGGSSDDFGRSCYFDPSGSLYLSGYTFSTSNIASSGAHQITHNGGYEGFISKFKDCIPGYSTQTHTACLSYKWPQNGRTYRVSGNYTDTMYEASYTGCDSIVTLKLTINKSTSYSLNLTVCDSFVWQPSGRIFYQSGFYRDTLKGKNQWGCDSFMYLNLTVNKHSQSLYQIISCGSYLWNHNNKTYHNSGTYTDTLYNGNNSGCDSVVFLYLTIGTVKVDSMTVSACNSWRHSGKTYTQSGIYYDTIINGSWLGCDSISIKNITIRKSSSSILNVRSCGNYQYNNKTYKKSGVYTDTFFGSNKVGCDSIVTINLTINDIARSSISDSGCGFYTWKQNNISYHKSGLFLDTLEGKSYNGCDSIVALNLTINPMPSTQLNFDGKRITAVPFMTAYNWLDCDSTYKKINNQTDSVFYPNKNGMYAVVTRLGDCIDTSTCIIVSGLQIDGFIPDSQRIFPNPANNYIIISGYKPRVPVVILNMAGQCVFNNLINNPKLDITFLPVGVYLIKQSENTAVFLVNRN